jgi:hypothetical protein
MKDPTSPADNLALALATAYAKKPQTKEGALEAIADAGATLQDRAAVLQWAKDSQAEPAFYAWETQAKEAAEKEKRERTLAETLETLGELRDLAAEGGSAAPGKMREGMRALLDKLAALPAPEAERLDLAALTRHLETERDGIDTGLEAFKAKDIRLPRGALTVICARPGKGKTSLMLSLARNLARVSPVLFYSYEEAVYRLAVKLALGILGKDTPKDSGEAWKAACRTIRGASSGELFGSGPLGAALETMRVDLDAILGRSLYFYEGPASIAALISAIRRERERLGEALSAVFIDYAQLIPSGGPGASYSRQTELAGISAALRDLAKETGLAVIMGAQLTRGQDGAEEAYIREADDILNDANLVLVLDRKSEGETEQTVLPYEARITKNRDGATGARIELAFRGRCRHFVDPGSLTEAERTEYERSRDNAQARPKTDKSGGGAAYKVTKGDIR